MVKRHLSYYNQKAIVQFGFDELIACAVAVLLSHGKRNVCGVIFCVVVDRLYWPHLLSPPPNKVCTLPITRTTIDIPQKIDAG